MKLFQNVSPPQKNIIFSSIQLKPIILQFAKYGIYEQLSLPDGVDKRWVFPNITPEDFYLLINFFFALEKRCQEPQDQERFRFAGASKEGVDFYFDLNSANFDLRLAFLEGAAVLTSEWGGE